MTTTAATALELLTATMTTARSTMVLNATAELAHTYSDGSELFLVTHDGNREGQRALAEANGATYGYSWCEAGALEVHVAAGRVKSYRGLGKSLRTVKALAKREAAAEADRAQLEALRVPCVLVCAVVDVTSAPVHQATAAERLALKAGDTVVVHGHGRWRVAIVTGVSRTGTVAYAFTTPTAVAEHSTGTPWPTKGTTKATDSLYLHH